MVAILSRVVTRVVAMVFRVVAMLFRVIARILVSVCHVMRVCLTTVGLVTHENVIWRNNNEYGLLCVHCNNKNTAMVADPAQAL